MNQIMVNYGLTTRQKIKYSKFVVPAKAGIHPGSGIISHQKWIPAFAGKTISFLSCTTNLGLKSLLYSLLLCSSITVCLALPADNLQVIKFRADSADINQTTHLGVYTGNVQLDQGTTHIRAAEALTEGNKKNQLIKAIIKGNKDIQAHYWTIMTNDKPPLHAFADTINYYPDKQLIELMGNARVKQGNNSFTAPKIIYDMVQQHIVSESNGTTRTTIIIHPEKHS